MQIAQGNPKPDTVMRNATNDASPKQAELKYDLIRMTETLVLINLVV